MTSKTAFLDDSSLVRGPSQLTLEEPSQGHSPGFDSILSLLKQLQQSFASLQNEVFPVLQQRSRRPSTATDPSHPPARPFNRCDYSIQLLQNQVLDLQNDVVGIKQQLNSSARVCSGPSVLVACLLAISLFAISIIVLASLGLAGILPQVVSLLVTQANMLWAVVSASIVTVICLTSVCSVFFIKPQKTHE